MKDNERLKKQKGQIEAHIQSKLRGRLGKKVAISVMTQTTIMMMMMMMMI